VCLYSRGISWKGATFWGFTGGSSEGEPLLHISQDTLLAVVSGWIIDGRTQVGVAEGHPPALAPASGCEPVYTILTPPSSPFDAPGQSLLWPACSHHQLILEMRDLAIRGHNPNAETMLKFLLDEAQRSLFLPEWAFDAQRAAEANMWGVVGGLEMYRLIVGDRRKGLLWQLRQSLSQWLTEQFPEVNLWHPEWSAEWLPRDAAGGWDGVYWAFRECGLPLDTFGREFPAWLRQLPFVSAAALAGWSELGV
jgi:hypothetical protein